MVACIKRKNDWALVLGMALLLPHPASLFAWQESIAYASKNQVDVWCGPSDEYYVTGQLPEGATVRIIHETRDGWLGIQPPDGSFNWVAATDVHLLAGGRQGEVSTERTTAWIGSEIDEPGQFRWQVQLPYGTPIPVQGESRQQTADGTEVLWYRIAPPDGELRWIRKTDVTSQRPKSSRQTAVRQASHTSAQTESSSIIGDEPIGTGLLPTPAADKEPSSVLREPRRLDTPQEKQPVELASAIESVPVPPQFQRRPKAPPKVNPLTQGLQPTVQNSSWDNYQAIPEGEIDLGIRPMEGVAWLFGDFVRSSKTKAEERQARMMNRPRSEAAAQVLPPNLGLPQERMLPLSKAGEYVPPNPLLQKEAGKPSAEQIALQQKIAGDVSASIANRLPRPRRRSSMELDRLASRRTVGEEDEHETHIVNNEFAQERTELAANWNNGQNNDNEAIGSGARSAFATSTTGGAVDASYRDTRQASRDNQGTDSWHGISDKSNISRPSQSYTPIQITDPDLLQIQLALTAEVARSIESWQLQPIQQAIEKFIDQSNDPAVRGEARLLLERVESFADVQRRSISLSQGSMIGISEMPPSARAPVVLASANEPIATDSGIAPTSNVSTSSSNFDATGWLVPVHSTHPNQPEYAITDDRGDVVAYVSPMPGVNLRRYLRQPVGLVGRRGYIPELETNHILVERASRLTR